jgi:hypothetical protein
MTAESIDPAAISLPPTQPIDITDCLPDPHGAPTAKSARVGVPRAAVARGAGSMLRRDRSLY